MVIAPEQFGQFATLPSMLLELTLSVPPFTKIAPDAPLPKVVFPVILELVMVVRPGLALEVG
jgi:hypothetical protein